MIFITFGSKVWPLRKPEHLQLLFTSAAVVVKNTPLLCSLKHCGAINRALFLQVPSPWELCNDCEGFLHREALPFTRQTLPPSQPASHRSGAGLMGFLWIVWWEVALSCPQPPFLQQLGLVLRWSCLGDNSIVKLWALGSVTWVYLLGFFQMSQSVAGCQGCWLQRLQDAFHRLRSGSWEHQGCRAVTLTLPSRKAAGDMGCPPVNAARSLWEDEGCWMLMFWEFW